MSGGEQKKHRGPLADVEADEIDSALEEAFTGALPDPDVYDPFAPADEDDTDELPPLELSLPEPQPQPTSPTEPKAKPTAKPTAKAAPGAAAPSPDLDTAWQQAKANLDDASAQQRFVRACLAAGQLPFAVRCYRSLAEAPTSDPRAARELEKVGTLLGFHAPPAQGLDDEMSPRLKAMLFGIALAGLAIAGAAWWFG